MNTYRRTEIKKLLETMFLIAICRLTGDKRQSKTLFLAIIFLRSSIDNSIFDCRLFSVVLKTVVPVQLS